MLDDSLAGQKTDPVTITVTRKMIADYVTVIGEKLSIYYDTEQAKESGYPDVVIPSTYPTLFWKYINIPWLENVGPLIHGKQSFRYNAPLLANQTYDCFIELVDMYKKNSTKGVMQFLTHRLVILSDGREVAEAVSILILQEKGDSL